MTPAGDPPLHSLVASLSRGDRVAMAIYVVLSLGSALAGSLAAVFLVPLVQPGQALPFTDEGFGWRVPPDLQLAVFVGVTVVFALLRWQSARVGARLVGRYGMNLRRRVHARLVDAPLVSLADATSAEIANVLTYNVEIVVQGFSALQQLLVAGVTAAVSLGFAFWLSPPLMLAAPLLLAVGLLASRVFGREQSRVSRQYVADMTRLFWHSEDFPRRLRHVRSFEREASEKASYGEISAGLAHGYARQLELVASGRLLLEGLAVAGIAVVFVLARHWRGIDPASLIAVCLLLGRLLPYLVSTRQSFQQLRSAAPAFELWQRYMRLGSVTPVACAGGAVVGTLHIDRMRVVPPVEGLDVVGLDLVPGRMTLVFGDSGIGKSSLVDVLAGMVEPARFEARADGRPMDFEGYRERVRNGAYVSQSVRPWQASVRDCLLWAAPGASDGVLREVLLDVGLDARLARSEGLDTSLHSSSSRLSGGELQRLMLAQVILRQPSMAVLDEATSALDAASERMVLATLKRRLPRTILIVVSHRADLATIADQTLLLGGDVASTVAARPVVERYAADVQR